MSKARDIADSAATINQIDNLSSDAQSQIDAKAPISSPTFSGTVSGTFSGDGSSLTGIDSSPYSVCSTKFFQCAEPVLDTSAGTYFKIRATGNTNISVTGSATTVVLDYISNLHGSLSLPNSFKTQGYSGNTINDLVVNNRYRIEYSKIGSEYHGTLCHLEYYPSSQTRRMVSFGQVPCHKARDRICTGNIWDPGHAFAPIGTSRESYCNARQMTDFTNCTQGTYDQDKGQMRVNERSLNICYGGKPYVLQPTSQIEHKWSWSPCCNRTHQTAGNWYESKYIVWGYDPQGFRCIHKVVDWSNQNKMCACNEIISLCCTGCADGYPTECCAPAFRCMPECGKYGDSYPLAYDSRDNTLLTAESPYARCKRRRLYMRTWDLQSIMEDGVARDTIFCGQPMSLPCVTISTCYCTENALLHTWSSLTAYPNWDFAKCGECLPLSYVGPAANDWQDSQQCMIFVNVKKTKHSFGNQNCAHGDWGYTTCHSKCLLSHPNSPFLYGAAECCLMATGDRRRGGQVFLEGGKYFAIWGSGNGFSGCTMRNKIQVFCNTNYGSSAAPSYLALTGNGCCFCTQMCTGSLDAQAGKWWWDCKGCHFVHMNWQESGNNCQTTYIISRHTAENQYIETYCCRWCAGPTSSTGSSNCCNIFPRGGKCGSNNSGPAIAEIDISDTNCHCIYSAAASCEAGSTQGCCGMNFDPSSCTWAVGNQSWKTTVGANTAPDKLFFWSCDYTTSTLCDCDGQFGGGFHLRSNVVHYKDGDGAYVNQFAIHPLSNTELFAI